MNEKSQVKKGRREEEKTEGKEKEERQKGREKKREEGSKKETDTVGRQKYKEKPALISLKPSDSCVCCGLRQ